MLKRKELLPLFSIAVLVTGCASRPAVEAPVSAAMRPPASTAQKEHRFYMTQNGQRMSAEDFDAWMRARGVRVARGAAPAPAVKSAKAVVAAKKPSKRKPVAR